VEEKIRGRAAEGHEEGAGQHVPLWVYQEVRGMRNGGARDTYLKIRIRLRIDQRGPLT